MKVLSLFDGMSCWMLALQRAWISVEMYYASEIDKYATQVSYKNFPEIFSLWDITKINRDYYINDRWFDLLIGWSPCQGFSFAGKQLNFEDPRSKLFFEYVRILKEVQPKYFLLENVKMKKEFQDIISENLFGVKPIEINSALMSAQNRRRLYWVGERQEDWSYKQVHIDQPEDKGTLLKDILENEVDWKYYLSNEVFEKLRKFESNARLSDTDWKSYTLNTMQGGHRQPKIIVPEATKKWFIEVEDWGCVKSKQPQSSTRRGRDMTHKSNCLTAWNTQFMKYEHPRIRKLTPLECTRLQTVPDNYFEWTGISNSQIYKMLGNGWTVDVLAHIFSFLK